MRSSPVRDRERPFDWMLDLVAPFMGWVIGVSIFVAAMRIAGCA